MAHPCEGDHPCDHCVLCDLIGICCMTVPADVRAAVIAAVPDGATVKPSQADVLRQAIAADAHPSELADLLRLEALAAPPRRSLLDSAPSPLAVPMRDLVQINQRKER